VVTVAGRGLAEESCVMEPVLAERFSVGRDLIVLFLSWLLSATGEAWLDVLLAGGGNDFDVGYSPNMTLQSSF